MRYIVTIQNGNDKSVIFDTTSPAPELMLIDPNLHLEADAAGTFETTIPITNFGFRQKRDGSGHMIEKMKTLVEVTNDTKTVWSGRVVDTEEDFKHNVSIYAEGAYSFLNDSIQFPHKFDTNSPTPTSVLSYILNHHNTKCPSLAISLGSVTIDEDVMDNNIFTLQYESSLEAVERLRDQYGGHMRISYVAGTPQLDWFKTYNDEISAVQYINFGVNLLDFTQKYDGTLIVNAIMPLGKVVNSSGSVAIGDALPITTTEEDGDTIDYSAMPNNINAWGNGYCIYMNENNQFDYEEESSYSSTGYWDSLGSGFGTPPFNSIEVQPGDIFYVCAEGYEGRILWIITEEPLGQNPAWVLSSKRASNSSEEKTELKYAKVTVPDSQHGYKMYLNVSSSHYSTVGTATPDKVSELNMAIYSSRKIPDNMEESITLLGLDNGTYSGYLQSSDTYVEPEPVPEGDYEYGEITFQKEGLYLLDTESIAKYGRIEKIIEYREVTEPSELARLSAEYLAMGRFEAAIFSVSALDLSILDNTVESPDVLDPIRIISQPHGVDIVLPVQERDIPLNKLSEQTFDISYDEKRQRMSDLLSRQQQKEKSKR